MTSNVMDAPTAPEDATRREFVAGGLSLGALVLGGCGGGEGDAPVADGPRFPVTLEHAFGATTIRALPQRVVTVGLTEQDPLLALGVRPVGVTEWFGDVPHSVWPWGARALGSAAPEVLGAELDLEAVAALRPDLVVALHAGITRADYDKLSRIAPTLARPAEFAPYNVPWQVQTTTIGRALGREAQARELIAGVQDRFAAARDRLRRYDGAAAVMVNGGPAGGNVNLYTRAGTKGQLLTDLGLDVPADLREGGEAFGEDQVVVSLERLDLVDRDVVIWNLGEFGDREAIEDLSTYRRLGVAREGRDVFVEDPELYAAIVFGTVLSLPAALDGLVPRLLAALDGDATTAA